MYASVAMFFAGGNSQLPPRPPHPALPSLSPEISNRHWKRLEIAVTHRKQSTDPFLIDNENALSRTRITVAISLSTIDDWQSANVYIPIKRSSRKTTACEVVGPARSARSYSVEL
jgi:hypothetical protein